MQKQPYELSSKCDLQIDVNWEINHFILCIISEAQGRKYCQGSNDQLTYRLTYSQQLEYY